MFVGTLRGGGVTDEGHDMTGWMPSAERAETAAQGDPAVVAITPVATCYHVMEGWLSTMRLWAAERPVHHEVSYHFGLGLDGMIVQFVPITAVAWHAGRLDWVDSAGRLVKVGTPGARFVPPTWSGYRPSVNPNLYTIGVAAEGFSSSSNVWNPAQMRAAIEVQRWINEQTDMVSIETTVIGHNEIAPLSRPHDPGPRWSKAAIIEGSMVERVPARLSLRDPRTWPEVAWALAGYLGRRTTPVRVDGMWDEHLFRVRSRR